MNPRLSAVDPSQWRDRSGEPFSVPGVELAELTLDHIDGESVYAVVAAPTAPIQGGRPAVLVLQNHGGGAWPVPQDWAAELAGLGFVALVIQTHDVENGREDEYYRNLNSGPLASCESSGDAFILDLVALAVSLTATASPDALRGVLDRSTHYFRSVYLRIVRGLDYLSSRDDWDGKTLLLTGRSQGGGLALVGAGLEE